MKEERTNKKNKRRSANYRFQSLTPWKNAKNIIFIEHFCSITDTVSQSQFKNSISTKKIKCIAVHFDS